MSIINDILHWWSALNLAEYVGKYATKENVDEAGVDEEDSDEMSSVGSFDDEDDDQPVGTMDEV